MNSRQRRKASRILQRNASAFPLNCTVYVPGSVSMAGTWEVYGYKRNGAMISIRRHGMRYGYHTSASNLVRVDG